MDDLVFGAIGVPEREHDVVGVGVGLPVELLIGEPLAEQAGIPVPELQFLRIESPTLKLHLVLQPR
jgi:hypothetical protein